MTLSPGICTSTFCELGAEVLVKRNDELTLAEIASLAPEKIVISPGPCTPDESGISLDVIRRYAGKTPLLGVCLGHQAIARSSAPPSYAPLRLCMVKRRLLSTTARAFF